MKNLESFRHSFIENFILSDAESSVSRGRCSGFFFYKIFFDEI